MASASTNKPERPAYEVKIAKTRDEVEACFDIRVEVFHVEQGFSMDEEIDAYDKEAVHILLTTTSPSPPSTSTSSLTPWFKNLTDNVLALLPEAFSSPPSGNKEGTTQVPIGTIRYVPKTNKLSRLAILGDWRKYGFGRVLVEELEKAAGLAGREGKAEVKDGKVLIKCHSQVYVIPFYEKLGYVQEGERFDEDGGLSAVPCPLFEIRADEPAPHQKMVKSISI